MSSRSHRREFLSRSGAGLMTTMLGSACGRRNRDCAQTNASAVAKSRRHGDEPSWGWVRDQFELSPDRAHLSALLIASHPTPVRDAIALHRLELDREPSLYLIDNNPRLRRRTLSAAAEYLNGQLDEVALTDSTTMGLGLVYNGIQLRSRQEIVTTEHDHYSTHEALRLATERSGARRHRISLYARIDEVSADEVVNRISSAVTPTTRVVAITWVHSSTGLKLPLREIAQAVRTKALRQERDAPLLLCIDGVHGFGVEDVDVADLGIDVFISGCHKWLFGPRGTGIVWATRSAWSQMLPTIPSFIDHDLHEAWLLGKHFEDPTTAQAMTPGGFKPFEHQWALAEAFEFHRFIGRSRIAARTHELARQCKEGLADMPHVLLRTPMDPSLSSGIVCFDVEGLDPFRAAMRLGEAGIVASVTPYASRHLRLSPCIYNSPEDVDAALRAIRSLA